MAYIIFLLDNASLDSIDWKKNVQYESFQLSFIWGKMMTVA